MNNTSLQPTEALIDFLSEGKDIDLAKKLAEKYSLSDEDFVNLAKIVFLILIKQEDIESTPMEDLVNKYLPSLSEETKKYLAKDLILEIVPLLNRLWQEEKVPEQTYEEKEGEFIEIMEKVVKKLPIKRDSEEEKEKEKKEKEGEEEKIEEEVEIPAPVTISWKPAEEEVVKIEENEEPKELASIEIEYKKTEEKKDEEAIDLSQI